MDRNMDCIVIGGGPAGLAAAVAARSCGLDVSLLDEQAQPGGQLFRNVENPRTQPMFERKELATGLDLVKKFRECGATYHPKCTVWGLEPNKVYCTIDGKADSCTASNIIIAPGAMERPVPFPGWTLPGVMGAGAADILLRSGVRLDSPVVLAGNGPLLLALACHLIDAGVRIAAWLDTGNWKRRLPGFAAMPAGVLDMPYLTKGMKMALKILRKRIPMYYNVKNIRALGTEQVERVSFTAKGKEHTIAAALLLRHEGIIPRTQIAHSMGIEPAWDKVQRCWYIPTNECGETSIPGVYVAGDSAYVDGGDASILKGTLAGIDVARRMHVISDEEAAYRSAEARRALRKLRTARNFLRYVFAPNPEIFDIPDDTLVCRCESVSAGKIRDAVKQGFLEVSEIKRVTRCGMGHCQGRMCGPALAEIAAAAQGLTPDQVGILRARQPFRPVSLKEYCELNVPKK